MGVPPSEVGYTSATTGRGDHEVHKGYVVALEKKMLAGLYDTFSNPLVVWQEYCYYLTHPLSIFK
jgi:hypothetical protein